MRGSESVGKNKSELERERVKERKRGSGDSRGRGREGESECQSESADSRSGPSSDLDSPNDPSPLAQEEIWYLLRNEKGDGRCSAHGAATILSMDLDLLTETFVSYTKDLTSLLQNSLKNLDTEINSDSRSAWRSTNKIDLTNPSSRRKGMDRLATIIGYQLSDLETCLEEFLDLTTSGSWHTNLAAKGAEFFGDFISKIFENRGNAVTKVCQFECKSLNMTHNYRWVTQNELKKILVDSNHKKAFSKRPLKIPFEQGRLVFFLTNGSHWFTVTPRSLLLPSFLLKFPPPAGEKSPNPQVSPPTSQDQTTPIRKLTFENVEKGSQSTTPQKKKSVQTNIMDLFAGRNSNPFGPLSSPLVRKQVSPLKGVPDQLRTKSPAKKKSSSTEKTKGPLATSRPLSQ